MRGTLQPNTPEARLRVFAWLGGDKEKMEFCDGAVAEQYFFIIYLCLDTAVYSNMNLESEYQHKAAGVYKKGRVGVRVLVRVEQFGPPPIHCSFHSSSPCFII